VTGRWAKLCILGLLLTDGNLVMARAEASDQASTVRIVRDSYGVPHIYADNSHALFYGYGYAVGHIQRA